MSTIKDGKSRFDQAKDFILNFRTEKIGVISFGENVIYSFPLSENKNNLKDILNNIKLGNISDGEDIIGAIKQSIQILNKYSGEKNLFVLSDGGKGEINFDKIKNKILENKINLNIIPIGGNQPENLTLKDSSGQSRQVKDKGQIVSTSQNAQLKNINFGKHYQLENYKYNFLQNEIVICILILLYLGTYLKLK